MITHRNKLATHTNIIEKYRDFNRDRNNGGIAYKSDNTTVPLTSVKLSDVEFIAGLWRVQNPFTHKIQDVRGVKFVLHDKLPHTEKNLFEFYHASQVAENCYGKFLVAGRQIVAKYTTDRNTYWSYGNTIEQARAFLGIKLYDEYMDLIHSVACKKTMTRQKK